MFPVSLFEAFAGGLAVERRRCGRITVGVLVASRRSAEGLRVGFASGIVDGLGEVEQVVQRVRGSDGRVLASVYRRQLLAERLDPVSVIVGDVQRRHVSVVLLEPRERVLPALDEPGLSRVVRLHARVAAPLAGDGGRPVEVERRQGRSTARALE